MRVGNSRGMLLEGDDAMAHIQILDLAPMGSELFSGSESYMDEVTSNNLVQVHGGGTPFLVVSAVTLAASLVLYGPAKPAY